MSGFLYCFVFFATLWVNNALVIPKSNGPSRRVHDKPLSDEEHYQKETFHNTDYDHEAFLGEKEAKTFNELSQEESKRRLGIIVDKIDTDKDNFVSLQELKEWIQHTQRKYIKDDCDRQWRNWNPFNKPELTWDAYKKYSYGYVEEQEAGDTYGYKEMIERDLRRWEKADQDQNGSLNKIEFMDFVHPEESLHMKDIIVIETMEDIDKNRDGKISIEEYIGDMYNDPDNDVESEPSWVQSEREQFINFRDKDRSGSMEFNEVRDWILPSEYDNSAAEANHLIYESDVDRDNQLSKEEILDKFDLFVGSDQGDTPEIMGEILTTARHLELEVKEDDKVRHEDELTTELQEILNEEHQETQRNVSPSEQEDQRKRTNADICH
ncbi:calumenin-B [Trichonephila clavipes]|nr:calumenin-B [Trichonephila clavipes]